MASAETSDIDLLIVDDIRDIRKDLRSKEKNIREIRKTVLVIEDYEIVQMKSSVNLDAWNKAVTKSAEIQAAKDDTEINDLMISFFLSIQEAFPSLDGENTLASKLYDLRSIYNRDSYMYRVIARARDNGRKKYREIYGELDKEELPTLDYLDREIDIDFDERITKKRFGPQIDKLVGVTKVNPTEQYIAVKKVVEKAKAAELDEVNRSLKSELKELEDDIETLKESLALKVAEYQSTQKSLETRKAQTDQSLVYAVYGMILVLLLLFLGLKVFTDEVAKSLIVNRSLVEVVGMAFMLITIIILGTGEKLSKEILGTLLGTIAGYVFARSTDDKKHNEDQKQDV